jgi:hypothetical protein
LSPLGAMLGVAFGSPSPVLVEKKHPVSIKAPPQDRFVYTHRGRDFRYRASA